MSLKGNLASVNLTEIFQMLSLSGREGTLFIYEGARKRAICFTKDGVSIRSRERNESNLIGKILVRMGKVDEADLQRAIEQKRSSPRLLGDVLVENGCCSKEDVEQAFRVQSTEDIQELFLNRTDAQFEYVDGYFPETDAPYVELNVNQLLIEIARRTDEWEYIRRRIRGPREIYRFTGSEGEVASDVLHECYAYRIDPLIDGSRSVGDVIEASYVNKFEACKLLAAYLDANVIEPVPPDAIRQSARLALKMGDAESAIRHYEFLMSAGDFALDLMAEAAEAHEANRDFSESAALLRRLAEEMVRAGDDRGAIDALRRIANYPRPEPDALRYMLEIVFSNPKAAADFGPHVVEAGKTLVAHYVRCEQRTEAHALLERLIQLHPDEISFAVSLVDLYYDQGNIARAASECERMAHGFLKRKQVSPAVSLYKRLLVIDPERQDVRDRIRKIVAGKKRKSGPSVAPRVLVSAGVVLLLGAVAVVVVRGDAGGMGRSETPLDAEVLDDLVARARAEAGMAGVHARNAMREYARLAEIVSGDPLAVREELAQGVAAAQQNHEQFDLAAEKADNVLEMIRKQARDDGEASMARTMLSTIHDQRSNLQAERAKWDRRARTVALRLRDEGEQLYKSGKLLGALARFEVARLVWADGAWIAESGIDEFIRNIRGDRDKVAIAIAAARDHEAHGRWIEARRVQVKLLEEFGNADIVAELQLPVELVTVPSGAAIRLDGETLPARTPHVVRLAPGRTTRVRLEREGYQPAELDLGPFLHGTDPERYDYAVSLEKAPTWEHQLDDRIEAMPAVRDGRLMVMGRNGSWAILDAVSGARALQGTIRGGEGFTAGLVSDGRRFFAVSLDRKLYSIDARTGRVGSRDLPLVEAVYARPYLLRDEILYIADQAGTVIAIDALSGSSRWPAPVSTPYGVAQGLDLVAQGEDLVVTTRDGKVSVLRLADGSRAVEPFLVHGPLGCPPAVVGGDDLIFASEDGWLQSWDRARAARRWERQVDGPVLRTPPVRGRAVFVSIRAQEFLAIDVNTNDTIYRYRPSRAAARTDVSRKGRVFFVSGRTLTAYAATPAQDGYGPAWTFEARGRILAGPYVADGGVFIGDEKGYLYRLEAEEEG